MASSSSEEEEFDCSGLPHTFDLEEQVDYHQRLQDRDWTQCDNITCSNQYSGSALNLPDWALPVTSWQEDFLFTEYFTQGPPPGSEHLTALPDSDAASSTLLSEEFIDELLMFDGLVEELLQASDN